jgi:hypothetical protein
MENKKDAHGEDSVLNTVAKTLGTVAGKIAWVVTPAKSTGDVEGQPTPPLNPKSPQAKQRAAKPRPARPVKKNKARLPRKQKKALKQAGEV